MEDNNHDRHKDTRTGGAMTYHDPAISIQASLLGRMLTRFQLSVEKGWTVPLLLVHAKFIHKASGELITLLENADPNTAVRIDPRLSDATASLFEELERPIPDTLPEDWA